MHSLQTRIVAVTLSLLLGLASCYDNDPNYPPEPEISFLNVGEVSFDGVDNDVTLYLTLQDGDGDVGTPEGESPSCRADGNFCEGTGSALGASSCASITLTRPIRLLLL